MHSSNHLRAEENLNTFLARWWIFCLWKRVKQVKFKVEDFFKLRASTFSASKWIDARLERIDLQLRLASFQVTGFAKYLQLSAIYCIVLPIFWTLSKTYNSLKNHTGEGLYHYAFSYRFQVVNYFKRQLCVTDDVSDLFCAGLKRELSIYFANTLREADG